VRSRRALSLHPAGKRVYPSPTVYAFGIGQLPKSLQRTLKAPVYGVQSISNLKKRAKNVFFDVLFFTSLFGSRIIGLTEERSNIFVMFCFGRKTSRTGRIVRQFFSNQKKKPGRFLWPKLNV
jgi:hypothetical protein